MRRGLEAGLGNKTPDAALFAETLAAFDRSYAVNLFRQSRLYTGVADTLPRLRAAGIVLGCVTNKRERFARTMLEAAGIEDQLSFIYGGDSFERRKPDPLPLQAAARAFAVDPSAAVMVGDSVHDRDAAGAAGFAFVLAAYGYVRSGDDGTSGALAVITSFAELGEVLCRQGPDK